MRNIKATRKGNILTLEIDLSKDTTPSSSGKTMIVASTEGNSKVDGPGGWSYGLNVFTKEGVSGS